MEKYSPSAIGKIHEILSYNPETGILSRKPRSDARSGWNERYVGTEALAYVRRDGYKVGMILGRMYRAHVVAFALYHGFWAPNDVDHINGVKSDNRISNLRPATRSENLRNRRILDKNKSGFSGVSWVEDRSKWTVRINEGPVYRNMGYFDQLEDAVRARMSAEMRIWGHHHKANIAEAARRGFSY